MRQFQFTATESDVQATVVDIIDPNTQLFTIMDIRGGKDNIFENRFPWKLGATLFRAELKKWYEDNKSIFDSAYEYGGNKKIDFSKHFIQGTSTYTDNFTANVNGVTVWFTCDSEGNFYYDAPELCEGDAVEISFNKLFNEDTHIVTCEVNDLYGNLRVVDMYRAFRHCDNLESCVFNFTTKYCKTMQNLFTNDSKLVFDEKMIDDVSSCEMLNNIFAGIANETLDLSHWGNVVHGDKATLFSECDNLVSVNLGDIVFVDVVNLNYFAYNTPKLKSLDLANRFPKKITDLSYTFQGMTAIESLNLEGLDTSTVASGKYKDAFKDFNTEGEISYNSSKFNSAIVTAYNTLDWNDLDE